MTVFDQGVACAACEVDAVRKDITDTTVADQQSVRNVIGTIQVRSPHARFGVLDPDIFYNRLAGPQSFDAVITIVPVYLGAGYVEVA